MLWLALPLLHAAPAAVPTRALAPLVLVANGASGSDSGSSSGSASSSSSSGSGSSGSDSGSSSGSDSGSTSGSAASSTGSASGSTSGAASSTSAASSTGGASGTTTTTTGSIGTDNGDQEDGTVGVPSRCNSSDDCPLNFVCSEHKCKPMSQKQPAGGCATAEGAGLLGLLGGALALLRRRRAA